MLPVKIAGVGYYLPPCIVTSAQLESQLNLTPGWIAEVTGVRERRRCVDETSVQIGAAACRMALTQANLSSNDINLLIGASTAPEQLIPCTAALVHRELGFPDGGCGCFDVNATCLSFVVALRTAAYQIAAGAAQTALIYSSEIAHKSLNPSEPESAVLIGDAAAAVVLSRTVPGETSAIWQSRLRTYSSGADLTTILGGGSRHHPNDADTTPEMNHFHMNGPAIYRMVYRLCEPFMDECLSAVGWKREEINVVVPHQASGRGVQMLIRKGGFRPEQVIDDVAMRGNCVAASIPLALAEAVCAGRIQRGHKVLLIGSGAGLSLGAVALTF